MAWFFIVTGILVIVIGKFLAWRKFKRHEYEWYRRGVDGANAKVHCFLFSGGHVPPLSFVRYYSLCRRKYLDPLGNWERIDDPDPRIMCTKCMDLLRKKKN